MATKEKKIKEEKKEKVKKTPKQKRRIALKVIISIILIIALLAGILAVLNLVSIKSNEAFISDNIEAVKYEKQLKPVKDDKGRYTFVTDEDFKILQITDVHIGGGVMSSSKDSEAINAVAAMVTEEKPDLVVVTGDIAYPVPYQSGTFNNILSAKLFAGLMEKLGVYWCLCFGNHDTELYSYADREKISNIYESKAYPHCLFTSGDKKVDGYGNYVINIKDKKGALVQSLFMFDSHSYVDGDYFGIKWKYDCVHKNQVEWYEKTVKELTDENGAQPKSLAFFHIPPKEMAEAYTEYKDAGYKDTDNVKVKYGVIKEGGEFIGSSNYNYGLFDSFRKNGTQGVFFGHDHLNNMSLEYKGVRLTYGYSIDFLAYPGINKYGLQRGCSPITVKPDGTFESTQENYYQTKYVSIKEKSPVDLEKDMADETGGVENPFAEE